MTLSSSLARPGVGWAGEFAEDPSAVPVDIYLGGIRYPGEAVFAEAWSSRWGGPPGQEAMFRVVFLGSSSRVASDEINDDRVVVVVPSGDASSGLRPVAEEAAGLREARASYAVSGDPGLSRLTHAIEAREDELASMAANSMGRRWAEGAVIARGERPDLTALLPTLEHAGPDTWIEALGTWLIERGTEGDLPHSDEPLTEELTADIFDLIAGRSADPNRQTSEVAAALGLEGGASDPSSRFESGLDALLETNGTAAGSAVRALVTISLRMPPELGALYLVEYVRRRDAELVLAPATDADIPEGVGGRDEVRINRDTLPDISWDPRLLQRLSEVRSAVRNDWRTALPYLSAIHPTASPTRDDADHPTEEEPPPGRAAVREFPAEMFMEALRSTESSVSMTAMVVARLERALRVESVWNLDRLVGVLSAKSWSELASLARDAFGSARGFRNALAREQSARELAIQARAIERSVTFLDTAEFGVEHRPLELEAFTLRARFSAGLLDDVAATWPALRSDLDRWRTDYRRAYLTMHATRRALDEERQRKMARAIVQLAAVEGFAQLPELGPHRMATSRSVTRSWRSALNPVPGWNTISRLSLDRPVRRAGRR